MGKQINQLRVGVYLSYLNLLLGSLIPMFYTPVMLELLGTAEHGLYSLANSVIGYLSLLSLGFGSTIIRYLSQYRAEKNQQMLEQTFGFFLVLYGILALLVMICGSILATHASDIFAYGLNAAEQSKICQLLLIMTVSTALSFPVSVVNSVITAHEQYFFRRIVDIISTIAGPCLNLILLYRGYASVGMAAGSLVLQILFAVPSVFYCVRTLGIRPRFRRLPKDLVREMLSFSVYVFLGTIVDMLFWATDKVILGMLVSSAAVSVYQIGGTFNQIVMNLSTSISGVLTPRVTDMVVQNASERELSDLFIRVGRIQFLIVGLIVTGFAAFGQSFLLLWAGPAYADSYWIAILTLFPLTIPLIQNTGISILMAKNKHAFRSFLYLIIAVINVISTYLVTPSMGGIGAALCSCVSYLLGQGLVINVYYHRVIGLDIPRFWKNILRMALFPCGMMAATLLLQCFIRFDNWLVFFLGVAVYTLIYCSGMYLTAMNEYEQEVIRGPIRRIIGKFHR